MIGPGFSATTVRTMRIQTTRARTGWWLVAVAVVVAAGLWVGSAAHGRSGNAARSEGARWLRDYLRIDTSNPPGREHRAAAFLADILHRERIPTRLLVTPDGRANLYARLPAHGEPVGGPLVLTHHMDVVPAGPGWSVEPFSGAVVDGRMWGRGAVDIKSLGIAQLATMVDLKRRGVSLARDLVFVGVADEETGGAQGMGWLIEQFPELFADVWAVYNEGGMGHAVGERVLWWEVEVAQKRPLWLRATTHGRGGHGSGFHPRSSVHKLIAGLDRLIAMPTQYRVTAPVRDFLGALAPYHGKRPKRIFSDLDRYIQPDGPTEPMLPGITNLFVDTIQVTVLEGSTAINVIPAEASALIDIRMLPDTDAEALLARVREALGERINVEVLVTSPPSPPSPRDHPAYRAIVTELGEIAPVVPSFMSGFTDSRHFRERGVPAYGLSPFALTAEDRMGIHSADEAISIERLDRGIERMIHIVETCVAR